MSKVFINMADKLAYKVNNSMDRSVMIRIHKYQQRKSLPNISSYEKSLINKLIKVEMRKLKSTKLGRRIPKLLHKGEYSNLAGLGVRIMRG